MKAQAKSGVKQKARGKAEDDDDDSEESMVPMESQDI